MPGAYRISVYNKDGSRELLASRFGDFGIVVQSDRLLWNGADYPDSYVLFSNTNVIGYATAANATVAEYPIGAEYVPSFGSELTLYEVEQDPYNITFSKKELIIKCKDKTMQKDLVIKSEHPEPSLEEKTVDLSMASGNQEIIPTSGSYLSKVTITKPSTLIAGNIKKDINIGGVVGTLESGPSVSYWNGMYTDGDK